MNNGILGHDLMGMERFMPDVKHMIEFTILNSKSPIGSPGEHYRLFLSDEGYKKAADSENRGEIEIQNHSSITRGTLLKESEDSWKK